MDEAPRTPEALVKISKFLIEQNKVKYGFVWQGRQYEGLSCVFLEIVFFLKIHNHFGPEKGPISIGP